VTLREIAQRVGGTVHGDGQCRIHAVAPLENAGPGTIGFLGTAAYRKHLATTAASAVILRQEDLARCPTNALICADPYLSYARVAALLHPQATAAPGIDPTATVAVTASIDATAQLGPHAVVGAGASVGAGAVIGPGCSIGAGSRIGDHSRLGARVTVGDACIVGCRTVIEPGAVIGSEGFGFACDNGTWVRIPQLATVRIGDDVEIGANTTIDRGTLTDTIVEDGVKIDNQVQVGHNVQIGAHTVIAGCVGIGGSAKIGRHCALGGAVNVVDHVRLADHVRITAASTVTESIKEAGVYSGGVPLQANRDWRWSAARFKQLNAMARRLIRLEKAFSIGSVSRNRSR